MENGLKFEQYRDYLIRSRRKYQEVPDKKDPDYLQFQKHFKKNNFFDSNHTVSEQGKLFLYEKFHHSGPGEVPEQWKGKKVVSYPRVAMYVNSLSVDQTIELEYIDIERSWSSKTFTYEGEEFFFFDYHTTIDRTIIWYDDIFVYGSWDKLPDWKELRKHYEKTWWFRQTKQEKRNRIINSII